MTSLMHRLINLGVSMGLGCLTALSFAAAPPIESFFKNPSLYSAKLSPNGKRLAISAPGINGRVGLYVIDLQSDDFKPILANPFRDGDVNPSLTTWNKSA